MMYSTFEFALISLALIFFIVDPLGNIPVFLTVTDNSSPEEKRKIARRASLATFLILVVFAFIGEWILKLFRVTISSFQIAGGILIFIIAISMLQARRSRAKSSPEEEHERLPEEDVSIFPLAIPLLGGPAAITSVMVLINLSPSWTQRIVVITAIGLTSLSCYGIFLESTRLLRLLKQTGLNVLTRLMGLLLAVIAVQFVIDGLKEAFGN
ncbi:MAG: NAAT family transporter [Deltaproteobacteria bacterium]|nr:NAAT family transporter [Deltaproteobacteria bacterium]